LKQDKADNEVARDALELLVQIMTVRGREAPKGTPEYFNTETFIKVNLS
jgi:hypothetical protein